MTRTYRVSDFAKIAGVTVRTLHHYDRIGVLMPSKATDGGHRLYTETDLLRLQQIILLKWMGFSLNHIKDILNSPRYNLLESLHFQKSVVDIKIGRLQQVATALQKAVDMAENAGDTALDSTTIQSIISKVNAVDDEDWVAQFYDETAMASLQLRGMTLTPEYLAEIEQTWRDLYAEFEQRRDLAPDSPPLQALAARMHALITEFTAGDEAVEAGLKRTITAMNNQEMPDHYNGRTPFEGVDDDLRTLIQSAYDIYRKSQNA